jgi:hypothetical protein
MILDKMKSACAAGRTSRFASYWVILVLLSAICFCTAAFGADEPWTTKRANDWYAQQPWLVGSNFIPSTAINELEMWQPDTFDLPTIDRELGWA